MTKLEEIERAMCRAYHGGNPNIDFNSRAPWFADLARAAVEALREPTEGMQVAGATTDVGVAHTADHRGRCLTPSHVWRAMIDAILNETPEG